ncbi:14683_t:CDS:2, partial [Ambispora leptoticha]
TNVEHFEKMQQRQLQHSENYKKTQPVPWCFCNLTASVAYTDRGLIYECHYRHVNPWQQVLKPPFENDVSSSQQADIGICAFHVHAKPWFEILSKADRPNQNKSHRELSKCPYFNLTFCIWFNLNNTFPKRYFFAPKCNCGKPVVLDTSKVTGKLIFLCRNYYDNSALPRCSWSRWAENVKFENTGFNIHPLITKTNANKLLENGAGNNRQKVPLRHNSSSSNQNELASTSITNYSHVVPQNQHQSKNKSTTNNNYPVQSSSTTSNAFINEQKQSPSSIMNNNTTPMNEQKQSPSIGKSLTNTYNKHFVKGKGKSPVYESNARYPPESSTITNFYSDSNHLAGSSSQRQYEEVLDNNPISMNNFDRPSSTLLDPNFPTNNDTSNSSFIKEEYEEKLEELSKCLNLIVLESTTEKQKLFATIQGLEAQNQLLREEYDKKIEQETQIEEEYHKMRKRNNRLRIENQELQLEKSTLNNKLTSSCKVPSMSVGDVASAIVKIFHMPYFLVFIVLLANRAREKWTSVAYAENQKKTPFESFLDREPDSPRDRIYCCISLIRCSL